MDRIAQHIELNLVRRAQALWAETALVTRLQAVRRVRHLLADRAMDLAATVRKPARETLSSEILPLVEACRFLERFAPTLLAPRRWGSKGRPIWLFGVDLEVQREPIGVVLIVGPANYPLLLPAVQAMQALAAGNAVLIKPGEGGHAAACGFASCLANAGLPEYLCTVLPEEIEGVYEAIEKGVDKVFLTGSAATGRKLSQDLAKRLVPAVMELSGDDAVFVRGDADVSLVAKALRFGMDFNNGDTCIAPKRVYVAAELSAALQRACEELRVSLPIASVTSDEDALERAAQSPYALGAAVFGKEKGARQLAARIRAGVVVINDVIVPTADPRLPFGGRRNSGYGTTRGAEGLMEMTVVKAVTTTRGRARPHFEAARANDAELFASVIQVLHGAGAASKFRGLRALVSAISFRRKG
jgi:acyl-CoA reductase-like NAD-dependent aldehyde dehydrogenase